MSAAEIRLAAQRETRSAVRLVLAGRGQSALEIEHQVSAFLRYARAMSLDLSRLWVCLEHGRMVGACACIESPGRTALMLVPDSQVLEPHRSAGPRLLEQAIAAESRRDVRLLQCLLHPEDDANAAMLADAGFRELATLLYLECDPREAVSADAPRPSAAPPRSVEGSEGPPRIAEPSSPGSARPPGGVAEPRTWRWITYTPERRRAFADLILATYEASLDCPALSGLRPIDDIIAGHQAAGRFDPQHWLLLQSGDHAAGCILFAENPVRPALELVYMGVHPRERCHGIGTALLRGGLALARRERFEVVTVAVDAANEPALRLYRRHGFQQTTRRLAFVRPLTSTFVSD